MSKETLEIIQGLSQAAANAYDGSHDERFSLDGQARQVGLQPFFHLSSLPSTN